MRPDYSKLKKRLSNSVSTVPEINNTQRTFELQANNRENISTATLLAFMTFIFGMFWLIPTLALSELTGKSLFAELFKKVFFALLASCGTYFFVRSNRELETSQHQNQSRAKVRTSFFEPEGSESKKLESHAAVLAERNSSCS